MTDGDRAASAYSSSFPRSKPSDPRSNEDRGISWNVGWIFALLVRIFVWTQQYRSPRREDTDKDTPTSTAGILNPYTQDMVFPDLIIYKREREEP